MKITRRQAREITLCLVFDFGFNSEEKPEELLDLYVRYFPEADEADITDQIKDDDYISKVYFGVAEKIEELDQNIKNFSLKWKLERMSRVSVSILRIALFELFYMESIPTEVSINEAVELAKKYDNDDSYSFINGVLGAAAKKLEMPGLVGSVETGSEEDAGSEE